MFAKEREVKILEFLEMNKMASTSMLCKLTGASVATIRRDINTMDERKLLLKTHGGVQLIESEKNYMDGQESPFAVSDEEKRKIAEKAASLIQPGDYIFLGAGKTCDLLAHYIKGRKNINIVTTSVTAAVELADSPDVSTVLLGGDIRSGKDFVETLDEYVIESLDKYYFNKVFITVNGIDLKAGYSINNRKQLSLYLHLREKSEKFFVMADDSKFDVRAFAFFCEMDEIRNLVISEKTDKKYLNYYEQQQISYVVC